MKLRALSSFLILLYYVQEIERLAVLSELESLLKHSSKKFQSDDVVNVSVIKNKIKELTRV